MDIFVYQRPEEKKRKLLIIGVGVLIVMAGLIFWLNRPRAEEEPEAPAEVTEQTVAKVIDELNANTVRDFTQAEAEALAARIDSEWLPQATDAEKGQLYSLQARIFDRARMPAQAAVSLELALPFFPEGSRLNIYERLYSAHNRAGNNAKAKEYAILVVANTPETDAFGRATWQERVDGLTAQGY